MLHVIGWVLQEWEQRWSWGYKMFIRDKHLWKAGLGREKSNCDAVWQSHPQFSRSSGENPSVRFIQFQSQVTDLSSPWGSVMDAAAGAKLWPWAVQPIQTSGSWHLRWRLPVFTTADIWLYKGCSPAPCPLASARPYVLSDLLSITVGIVGIRWG